MASRKSPSQRDPMTRMSQAVRAGSPASMGGRVANATPVQTPGTPNRRVVGGGDNEHNGTGADSTAVGTGALADGDASTSLGDGAYAESLDSTAVGRSSAATGGTKATAFGHGSEANGTNSTALGATTNAIGSRTLAAGYQAYAHADDATAVGAQTEAADTGATAFGAGATAVGNGSLAVGYGAYVSDDRGIAIGNSASTNADSIAIGDRAEGGAGGNVVLGPVARATSTAASTGGCVIAGAGATSSAARTVAIGNAAHVTHADTGKIKVDTLEVESSSAAGAQTSVILTDSAGTRWLIGVDTSGNPIGLGAA